MVKYTELQHDEAPPGAVGIASPEEIAEFAAELQRQVARLDWLNRSEGNS